MKWFCGTSAFRIGAIIIKKKGKFEQPRTGFSSVEQTPRDEDLSWMNREPERPRPTASPEDAPTIQIPVVSDEMFKTHLPPQPEAAGSVPDWADPDPEYAPDEQPQRKKAGPNPGLLAGIIGGGMALVLVLAMLLWGVVLKNGKTIYPNVYVAGINVGGMSRQEAVAAVDDSMAASYASATLNVQLPDRTISFSPDQTNVALDADEAITEALNHGRDGNPFAAVLQYFSARSREHYIDLQTVLNLDTDYIRNRIDEVAQEVSQTPSPSKVDFNEAAGTITVTVGSPDRKLDADGLYDAVYEAFMNSDFTPLTWEYEEVPCEAVDLTSYYEEYCTEVQDAVYDEENHVVKDEVKGYGFDLEAANQRLATATPGSQVVIQFEELEPKVTKLELESQMFGTMLYSTSSSYVNNSNRTTNLRLACEALNGTILNPGETFSFNDIVGERTDAKGYLPATVYNSGASVQELGGGVCQVASTIYYATLHLDLEQVERSPHMYAVTYVEMGMDATIYWGSLDYKFKNTLDQPIKLQANIDNGKCNITFWAEHELDYTVKMSYTILATYPWEEVEIVDETKPVGYREEKETPYTGYKVVTYKTIYDADGKEISNAQEAVSTYNKRDHTFIVGPADTSETPTTPTDPNDPLDPDNPGDDNGDDNTDDNTGTTTPVDPLNPFG